MQTALAILATAIWLALLTGAAMIEFAWIDFLSDSGGDQ